MLIRREYCIGWAKTELRQSLGVSLERDVRRFLGPKRPVDPVVCFFPAMKGQSVVTTCRTIVGINDLLNPPVQRFPSKEHAKVTPPLGVVVGLAELRSDAA